jgi:hypothetical protein
MLAVWNSGQSTGLGFIGVRFGWLFWRLCHVLVVESRDGGVAGGRWKALAFGTGCFDIGRINLSSTQCSVTVVPQQDEGCDRTCIQALSPTLSTGFESVQAPPCSGLIGAREADNLVSGRVIRRFLLIQEVCLEWIARKR